ncbi:MULTISPECIES: FUSC family protein [Tenebrionibacter/Tenebrionicola group]|jgi:uncharacterized membrane protein YccC|uniref:FUSC family protein n=2 Tax=Tenebrionibacter/Tenebrionicola group TaxID=2969848 RepID=A0A8K0XX48_9ENTR|nr:MULTISPECIES: FUSC family protein [Tenebrionibacter/Tenebrionicola group]MBK4715966.1 FUSC family protein [Tenebrionibacter intestinalis]MBV4412090.1 FUSC family protein [Tenebrionicola larvae]MBV5096863.1 FUSC family protein [Tenebrionicola larvae]
MRPDKSVTLLDIRFYRHYRVVHGARVATAFVLTFIMVRLVNVPEGSWPLITLVVVMGPISFLGNVVPRAFERIGGTLFGAIAGLAALRLELWSLPLMLAWCAAGIFICGYLALGKKPYQALLIGVTLSVVVGAPTGDIKTALWRSGDVILGSLLAVLFTSIWPQRAFILWRIKLADFLNTFNQLQQAALSPNLVERPRLDKPLQAMLGEVVKMRTLMEPASKETHIHKAIFEGIQTVSRNIVCTLELQMNAWWASRESHFVMLNARTLRETQQMTQQTLEALARALHDGNPKPVQRNSEALAAIAGELRLLMQARESDITEATPIHGYAWLSLELVRQLDLLSQLIARALRK